MGSPFLPLRGRLQHLDTGISLPQLIETSRHTSSDGVATSASARPLACSRTWKPGSAEDYARIFGGSGRTGAIA